MGRGLVLGLAVREEISRGLAAGLSCSEIARRLGRDRSVISREVARHGGREKYRALSAERKAVRARARPKARKLEVRTGLFKVVNEWLGEDWSPKQVSERLRMEFPDDPLMRVSHESIYQALYVQAKGQLTVELNASLRRGQVKRISRAERRQRREWRQAGIPDMVMITDRPPEVADRAVPGHWEGDLIIGKGNHSAIITLVERSTRFCLLGALPDGRDATSVATKLAEMIATLPAQLKRSITWDQGKEMIYHTQFTIDTGVPVYFCDPQSPWQRGTNENTNGLLRQYFPKGTDLNIHSQEHLNNIARKLNGRPRETLGYYKPAEQLTKLLNKQ